MPTSWLEYAIFPFLLFFLGAALVTGLPLAAEFLHWREQRGLTVAQPQAKRSAEAAYATAAR